MRYKLVKLNLEHPVDAKLMEQGFIYRPVQCTMQEEEALTKIDLLVTNSRQALRRIYSGTLTEEQFDADLRLLEQNDDAIQAFAAKVAGVEFAYLNPFHSGRGFIED